MIRIQLIAHAAFVLLLASTGSLNAQNTRATFLNFITKDSVRYFCSRQSTFTSPECADYFRYTSINRTGQFNGRFVDITPDSIILAQGRYVHGEKDGAYETFYKSGKPRSKGNFKSNRPDSSWYFYNEDGSLEREFFFSGADTLLIKWTNKKGEAGVNGGKGKFNGEILGLKSFPQIVGKGAIENGRRVGKWQLFISPSIAGDMVVDYAREEFEFGKVKKGEYVDSNQKKITYSGKSLFSLFVPPDNLGLEKMLYLTCDQFSHDIDQSAQLKRKSEFGQLIFRQAARHYESRKGDEAEEFKIEFTINEQGKGVDFMKPMNYQDLASLLISTLKNQVRWNPATKNGKALAQKTWMSVRYTEVNGTFSIRFAGPATE